MKGAYNGSFTASLQSNLTDEVFGSVEVASKSVEDEWTEHEFEIVPESDAPSSNNTFSVTFDVDSVQGGALDFNLISLFPPTYKDRKNGLRVDIAQALADLNPVGHHILLPAFLLSRANKNRPSCDSQVATCSRVLRTIPIGTGKTL